MVFFPCSLLYYAKPFLISPLRFPFYCPKIPADASAVDANILVNTRRLNFQRPLFTDLALHGQVSWPQSVGNSSQDRALNDSFPPSIHNSAYMVIAVPFPSSQMACAALGKAVDLIALQRLARFLVCDTRRFFFNLQLWFQGSLDLPQTVSHCPLQLKARVPVHRANLPNPSFLPRIIFLGSAVCP